MYKMIVILLGYIILGLPDTIIMLNTIIWRTPAALYSLIFNPLDVPLRSLSYPPRGAPLFLAEGNLSGFRETLQLGHLNIVVDVHFDGHCPRVSKLIAACDVDGEVLLLGWVVAEERGSVLRLSRESRLRVVRHCQRV